jgi:eukaryotic-like serine/threonine-protein kinase
MKTKPLVVFCWVQVIVATIIVIFNFTSRITRPATGIEYSRVTGKVTAVIPGSPADVAGVLEGDRLLSMNGNAIGVGVVPLYFARAGEPVSVIVERGGVKHPHIVTTMMQEELRRRDLRGDPRRVLSAITGYLNFPVHIWMLALGAALLSVRPDAKDARVSALSLAYWAGGMFSYNMSGFGAIMEALPQGLRLPFLLTDAVYSAGFFPLCLHFAIVFPSERVKVRRIWEVLPYLVALPIFIESVAHGLRRLRGDVRPALLPWGDAYGTIGATLLAASLVVLGVRFARIQDANARRRLKLVFLSLLPGSSAFMFGLSVSLLRPGPAWDEAVALVQMPATMLGSAIYAYAVVRHRIYNVRVLVRRSIQYAFARGTLFMLMSLPIIGLALFLYAHRQDSLAVLLTGTPAMYILLILPLVLVIRYRKRVLESLDRRFFREQYDARRLLLQVVSMIRSGSDILTLSRAALDEIDRALHPKHISLWQLDPDAAALHRGFNLGTMPDSDLPESVEGRVSMALPVTGMLATLLSADDDPLEIPSRHTRGLLQRLPEAERDWLRMVDAYLLVPLMIDRRLVGLMVLGERLSEEPYSKEDRDLLRTLGAQLALTLDYTRLKQSPSLVWSPSTGTAPVHLHLTDVLQLCPRCGRCYAADARQCEADEQSLVPESGVPRIIEDKYVVTRLLGRGGMGSVYQATQTRLNRPVAVKVLLSHLVGSTSMRSRFEREARIVARLRHPAIVTIHDFGVLPSGHAYLIMEYLDGETLRKTILDGPMAFDDALEILGPVGDAIDAAHRVGVIHRDLKPENIMIVRDQQNGSAPRVLDFGLAKLTTQIGDEDNTLVQSGHSAGVVGTLMYMAPEVLSGHTADAKSDQYSLALIAYELLAGEHPLGRAVDLASVVRGHTEVAMPPIRDLARSIPLRAGAAIDRSLSKKPAERFGSVGELVEALRAS